VVSIFFKNLFLLKGGEWQALQCFTSPDSYTCKERSCFFLFSFLRSCVSQILVIHFCWFSCNYYCGSIFFKNLFLLKGGEWQALQCFTSPASYTCKERSCLFLFSFLRSCDPDSDMLRRTLSSPTSPGGHPPCLLSRGREGEERRPRKNPRSQKETALTKKEGESHHQKPKKTN